MVAGAVILQTTRHLGAPLWTGALLLTGLSACGLLAALDDPAGRSRAVRGGAGRDPAARLGGHPSRSRAPADRHRPGPGLGDRQPGAGADPALRVQDPRPARVAGEPAPGGAGARCRRGLHPGRPALGGEGRVRLAAAGGARPDALHPGVRRHRPPPRRTDGDHDAHGDLQRPPVRPAECPAASAIAGRPPRSGHRAGQRAGLRSACWRARGWPSCWPGPTSRRGGRSSVSRWSCWAASSGR